MPILKLSKDDPKKEMDFELTFQLSLSVERRLEMMFGSDAIAWLKLARANERTKTPLIIKRK